MAAAGSQLPGAYVAPMSHLDLTFMGTVEECLSRASKVFTAALQLLDCQPEFHFFVEYVLFLEAYRCMRPKEAGRVDAHIRAGRVELGAEWSGIYVAQEDEENLIRNVLYAKRYASDRYGIELETLHLSDIPGVVPQLLQLCKGLGIQNLVLTRCAPPDTLFWYEAPSGDRVLTWSAHGYHQAGQYGVHYGTAAMRGSGLAARIAAAAPDGVPPLFHYGADLCLPPPTLVATVREWNTRAQAREHLAVTTPTAYFRALRTGDVLERASVLSGELPSTWLYAEPNHAHISRWDGLAARALDAAERFCTLAWLHAGSPYPKAELEALWKAQLLARDHNYGGRGAGRGQPRKLAERRQVLHRAHVLLSQSLAALAERVEAPRESVPIVVFNCLNWDRTDVVHAHVSFYPGVDPARRDVLPPDTAIVLRDPDGQPVPYQVTADRRDTLGEFDLAFIAHDVPGLGYARYTLEPAAWLEGDAMAAGSVLGAPRAIDPLWAEAVSPDLLLDNGLTRLAISRASGRARLLALGSTAAALQAEQRAVRQWGVVSAAGPAAVVLDGLCLQGREELPEVCQTPVRALSYDDPAREQVVAFVPDPCHPVQVVAQGPVLAAAAVRGTVLGVPAELRYSLYRDQPWVDLEACIDWDMRRFGRVELAYEVPLAATAAAYGLPFGAGEFGTEHLVPGSGPSFGDEATRASWERTREICRWLDVANEAGGVAMLTDHRWTRVDPVDPPESAEAANLPRPRHDPGAQRTAVRCCLVRGGRMRPVDPVADGEDPKARLVFRFRFCPHTGSWQAARVPRLGWEAVQPPLTYTVNDTWSTKSMPARRALATVAGSGQGDPLLTCLKQAEDGQAVVARWYEANGAHGTAEVVICPQQNGGVERVDLLERQQAHLVPGGQAVGETKATTWATLPWEIVTVRAAMPPYPGG